jgi:hypothetical protein
MILPLTRFMHHFILLQTTYIRSHFPFPIPLLSYLSCLRLALCRLSDSVYAYET